MSLRAIWIVSLSRNFGKVVYCRRFTTAERRAKNLHGKGYVACPLSEEFGRILLIKLGLGPSAKEFIEWRDTASCESHLPVLSLKISGGELWPILVIEQYGYIYCCLPLVEEKFDNGEKLPPFKIPSVSVGFSVLLGIINFMGLTIPDENSQKFIDLNNHLSFSVPFGQPSDVEFSNVDALFHLPEDEVGSAVKQPAWKPTDYKGKQSVFINITEYIKCFQCDKPGVKTFLDVYGNIRVKAELEGSQTSLTLAVNNGSNLEQLSQDCLVLHPCAQLSTSPILSKDGASILPPVRKLQLSPPLHSFVLCHYTAPHCKNPPISGMYKLRLEKDADLLLQLKLDESMRSLKNHFDCCEARMTFLLRDCIKRTTLNPSCGSVHISEDKHTVIWNIGQKFSAKDLEVLLTGKIFFQDKQPVNDSQSMDVKDLYAQILFKQSNRTLSGCHIDPKRVHISSSSKAKIHIEQEVQVADYRIWNSIGDVPICLMPTS